MKKSNFKSVFLQFAVVWPVLFPVAPLAYAQQTLTWDANGGLAGTGGSGTWNTSSAAWGSGTAFQPWNNATFDNAIFGGTAGTVTLGVPINAHNLIFTASGYTFTGNVLTLGGFNPTITTSAALATFNSVVAGSNGLIKSGPGTLVLAGDNAAFSGVITATSGILRIDHVNALGTSNAASDLRLNKGSGFYFNVDYAHDYTLMGSTVNVQGGEGRIWSGSPTLTASTMLNLNGTSGALSGALADTGSFVLSLTRNNTGRMTLSGNNTYTGATTVSRGFLQLGSAGALSSGSNLIFNGAVGTGGSIELTSASGDFTRSLGTGAGQVSWTGDGGFQSRGSDRTVNIGGTGAALTWGSGGFVPGGNRLILGTSSANALDFQNGIDLSGGTRTIQAEGGLISGHARISGVLSGTGGLNLVGIGTGMLELTGANTYTGGTVLTSGTLVVGSDSNLGNSAGGVTFNSGTLENISSFTTARDVTLNSGGGTFQTDANLEVSGRISGAGGLAKTGVANLTLTGSNTYTGGTTISAGTLQVGDGGTTGSIVGDVSNSSLLTFNRSDDISYEGVISGAGALNKEGGGRLVLTGENAYTGGTTISAGTLQVGDGGTTGSIVGDVSNSSLLTFNRSDDISYEGVISGAGGLNKEGDGRLILTGESAYLGGTTINAGSLQIGEGGATGSIMGDVINNSVLTFNRSDNIVYGGEISGSGALSNDGWGVLTLTGDNTYTGGTTNNAGVLQIGDGRTTGSIVGNVSNDSILAFNRSDDISYGGVISGIGGLNKAGNGRLVLTGENTYTGGTTISAGALQIGEGGTSGSIVGDVSNDTLVAFNRSDDISYGGVISGIGGLHKAGGGKLVLTGENAYTGGTTISGGALQIGDGGNTGSISGDVNNNGVLAFNRTDETSFGGTISGTGSIEQQGPGRVTLTGANAYTGGTTISTGELQVGDGSTTGSITGNVNNDGILTFNRSNDIGYSGVVSGNGRLNKEGSGRLVLTGENAYTGGTTINAGILQVGAGGTTGNILGNVSNNSILVFSRSDEAGFSGSISGGGSVEQRGPGRLTLTGANAYSGGTTVSAGTLQIGDGGTTGNILGNVSNSGILAFNRSDATSFDGSVGGAGSLEQRGTGRLTLTGANIYTGGTTIGAGVLQIGNGGTSGSIVGDVSNNAVIAFNRSDDINYGGVISGIGRLNKQGGGRLVLTGENAYTGGTTVDAGTLQIGNGGTTGSIAGNVTNNGVMAFNRSDVMSFGGSISGGGRLEQQGSGSVTLTGANTYTGGTVISAGTLQIGDGGATGSIVGDVSNNGTLAFNRAVNTSYGGAITGSGTINKDGAGLLALTGESSGFQGTTSVNSGTLAVNGALGGRLDVHSGASIKGDGIVGTGAVAGRIAPGNSIGTIQVSGNYTQLPGSTYEVEIDSTGKSDRIAVAGQANIQGGTVSVIPELGDYSKGMRYTILTAAGGRTGQFDVLTQNLPFMNLGLSYDLNNVYLDTLGRNSVSFCDIAITGNQCAAGRGAESLGPSHSLYSAIVNLTDQNTARQAFDSLSGELHASAKGVMIEDSRFLREAVTDRVRQAFSPGSAQVPGETVQENAGTGRAFWTRAFGSFGHRAGDTNAARINRSIGGIFFGADTLIANTLRLGVAGGYSNASFNVNSRHSTGSSDNYHLALYGGTQWRALGLRLGGSYTWHDLETNRSIAFPGFADNAKGDYRAGTGQVFGELGYNIPFKRVSLEPFVGLAYVNLGIKGFHERGGLATLGSSRDSEDVVYTTVGINTATAFTAPGGLTAKARGMLGWRHAFDDLPTLSALAFNRGSTFVNAGAPIAENAMIIAAGLDANITKLGVLGISYTGQIFDGVIDNGIRANLNWRF